ncbi:uncharacterized protein LOC113271910 [Papaver somniferum]|uniref:uncharacterized protein LOC113271910 n=1 Tax=Papaver somniferum TaxID=3469 RepID=UPI000E705DF2|nr:uncharacterized protein LOC113271910 [Papaver somniferum]
MASFLKICLVFLVINILFQGLCNAYHPCPLNKMKVTQKATGKLLSGKPEYSVDVINGCQPCAQGQIYLRCGGFETVEKPDPQDLMVNEKSDYRLLNYGKPVYDFVRFKYAWDTQYNLLEYFQRHDEKGVMLKKINIHR